jgi:hypothetical protein
MNLLRDFIVSVKERPEEAETVFSTIDEVKDDLGCGMMCK